MPSAQPIRVVPPRHLPPPELLSELRTDKGPKHIGFDALLPGTGRRALELALRQDRKR
ncbi:MAG: hypothetical protein J0L58_08220 [Burkholderiales bacterium]|uniref:hypothetical protein n=1 Tax=Inhella sp. TaxID=1921806 RepID=UPI001AC68721|nr:hypothetical protein [Burkholderiales bacterium]